jgi:glycerophosphoryl diester phosphodiesterase
MSDPATDTHLNDLLATPQDEQNRALAARYAPLLRFDAHEPFFPLAAGYTIFRESGLSPSFRQGHVVDLAPEGELPASLAIEYAIWWDWDIGHLYELEHVWVYVDRAGRVVRGEASWHGGLRDMRHQGQLVLDGDHLAIYSEPGKHAFAPTPQWFQERASHFKRSETSDLAGISGVLITRFAQGQVIPTPLKQRLVHTYLARHAFEPSGQFDRLFQLTPQMLVPWPALEAWIPGRLNHWLDRLAAEIPPHEYRFLRIGHRGAAAHAPDNTLAGLRKAAALGADMVEFDVRTTADGQVVLAHDECLRDAAGTLWPIHESTLQELQAIAFPALQGGGERFPTLAQAFEVCLQEQIGAYVELKDYRALPGLAALAERYDLAGYAIVGSFRPDWLAECKALLPGVATSILFYSLHLDAVQLARSIGASYVHPCWGDLQDALATFTPAWVARVREAALGIICGSDDRPDHITALRRLGPDAICNDAPELLLTPDALLSQNDP